MPNSKRTDNKMTEQTARAEDAAAPQQDGSAASEQATRPEGDSGALAAELKDRLLRTLAEMENLRKRTAREVTDARLYGVTSLARDLLGVADNVRRALEAVTPAMRATAEPGVKAFIEPGDDPSTFSKYFLNILVDFPPDASPMRPAAAKLFQQNTVRKANSSSARCLPQGLPRCFLPEGRRRPLTRGRPLPV